MCRGRETDWESARGMDRIKSVCERERETESEWILDISDSEAKNQQKNRQLKCKKSRKLRQMHAEIHCKMDQKEKVR